MLFGELGKFRRPSRNNLEVNGQGGNIPLHEVESLVAEVVFREARLLLNYFPGSLFFFVVSDLAVFSLQSILANPLILHTGILVQSEHLIKKDANL